MVTRLSSSSSYRLGSFVLLVLIVAVSTSSVAAQEGGHKCDRLKASLTYTQEEAPRDLSGVLPVVVERVNQVLEGVVDVEVEWKGDDLNGRVGEHIVQCKVTRLASSVQREGAATAATTTTDEYGREVVTQCFHVPFSILDTNECTLPAGHAMRHQCHASAICINTIGSYECLCPRLQQQQDADTAVAAGTTADAAFWQRIAAEKRTPWEKAFSAASRTSCPSKPSTEGCCPDRVHVKDGATCRAAFRCPADPCSSSRSTTSSSSETGSAVVVAAATGHTCVPAAKCTRLPNPLMAADDEPNYICQCPAGLMGNGHVCRPGIDARPQPKVMYDGVTATEETVRNNYYCDCTKPVVDACSGFPACKGKHEICIITKGNVPTCGCKPGYVMHEKYGCVDESPPVLRLKNDPNGDQILRLKQGDVYKEYAVEIQDENAEEYLRSLKIAYSEPLPHGCFTRIGQFHVNYTIATPWTSPPYVRVRRTVIIEDTDECSAAEDPATNFAKTCPPLVPQCDVQAGATCVNTIGSYTCQCPKYTSGDGFVPGIKFGGDPLSAPEGFSGGTSCRDTHKPVIHLKGPNPKVFRVCACGGINGVMGRQQHVGGDNNDLRSSQQGHYDKDIKELVRSTAGAELCATYADSNPNANDCIRAYDETHKGNVDLSGSVKVGEPVQQSALHWVVPYDVSDAAGNAAATVWRDVIVEEVELADVETKFRQEATQHKEAEIQQAVQTALAESEKRKDAEIRAEVQKALAAERKRRGTKGASLDSRTCPACPPCDCRGKFDESLCEAICAAQEKTCSIHEDSFPARAMFWLEGYLPLYVIPWFVAISLLGFFFVAVRWFLSLIFSPESRQRAYIATDERERAMQSAVTVFHPNSAGRSTPGSIMNGTSAATTPGLPPKVSMATHGNQAGAGLFSSTTGAGTGSIFSPQPSVGGASYTSPTVAIPFSQQQQPLSGQRVGGDPTGYQQDIYNSPEVITPRRRGEQGAFQSPSQWG